MSLCALADDVRGVGGSPGQKIMGFVSGSG